MITSISGCIDNSQTKKNITNGGPYIYLNEDNLYVMWIEYNDDDWRNEPDFSKKDYVRRLSVFDKSGNAIVERKNIESFPKEFTGFQYIIENQTINVFSHVRIGSEDIFDIQYIKLNLNFEIVIDNVILVDHNDLQQYEKYVREHRNVKNSNGEFILVWCVSIKNSDKWDYELEYMKIDENANVVKEHTQLTIDSENKDDNPRIFCDTNNSIHITWQKQNAGIYYLKMVENGTITVPPTDLYDINVIPGQPVIRDDRGNLIYLPTYFHSPGVADSNNKIHIAYNGYYEDDPYTQFVAYVRLNSTGSKIDYQELSNSTDTINEPQIKIDSLDNVHIVWKEGNQIYYTRLDDNGIRLIDKMEVA